MRICLRSIPPKFRLVCSSRLWPSASWGAQLSTGDVERCGNERSVSRRRDRAGLWLTGTASRACLGQPTISPRLITAPAGLRWSKTPVRRTRRSGARPSSAVALDYCTRDRLARRARPTKRRRPRMPMATRATPATMSTGVSSPAPVTASPEEPLPVLPVDEGLLTTAATDVVVVVTPALVAGTVVVVVVEVVVVVDDRRGRRRTRRGRGIGGHRAARCRTDRRKGGIVGGAIVRRTSTLLARSAKWERGSRGTKRGSSARRCSPWY